MSNLDLRLGWFRLERDPAGNNRRCHRITFGAEPPQRTEVVLDGSSRPAYRCGGAWDGEGFRWVTWPGETMNQAGPPGGHPVYVQKHALNRLHERLLPLDHATVYFSLIWSLGKPVVIGSPQEDTFLVECRLAKRVKVGYLVARRLCDKVVITTFLFLTMQGTPEARQLAHRLRLLRPDIEYTGLDRLSRFLNSDLARDADLARAFEESGCRDLLQLRCEGLRTRPVEAAQLRHYLGFTHGRVPGQSSAVKLPH